jgi:hypothetical protein
MRESGSEGLRRRACSDERRKKGGANARYFCEGFRAGLRSFPRRRPLGRICFSKDCSATRRFRSATRRFRFAFSRSRSFGCFA